MLVKNTVFNLVKMRGFIVPLLGVVAVAVLVSGNPSPPVALEDSESTTVIVEFDEIKDGELINVKDELVVLHPGDDELDIEFDSDETENKSTVVVRLEDEVESIDEQEETSSYTSFEAEEINIDFDSVPVPEPIHDESDIYINKDNIVPILKTLALAYTRKESPSYKDVLKAASLSGYKTAFKYLGKPSIGSLLQKHLKSYTSYLDDAEADDEETEDLSVLADKYLASHKFKMVFPESFLLHEDDMLQFAMTREAEEVLTGRSSETSVYKYDFATARADPVHTVLTLGPLTWLAVLGGLFSIPYFFTGGAAAAATERDDRVKYLQHAPSVWLQAPASNFRSGTEEEYHPHQAVDDIEYQRYLAEYDEWYRNWYHAYNNNQRPAGQQQVAAAQPAQAISRQRVQQLPPPVRKVQPQPTQKHHPNSIQHTPSARPIQNIAAPAGTLIAPPDSSQSILNVPSAPTTNNNFGTFQPSQPTRVGDSHFKVLQNAQGELSGNTKPAAITSTAPKTPAITQSRPIQRPNPSPQPVFRHNTTPKTETGFVPIIKPAQKPEDSRKSEFSDVKSSDVIQKNSNATKKVPSSTIIKNNATPAKPELKPSAQVFSSAKLQPQDQETTTQRLSPITSGVFKTTRAPTQKPATTPPPGTRHAIFVKSSTDKSVRVVTSSSVVLPDGSTKDTTEEEALPELQRPQRLVQNPPVVQQVDNRLRETVIVNAVPVSDPLIQARAPATVVKAQQVARPPPTVVKAQQVARPQSRPAVPQTGGFVRTNVPVQIQVVDHSREASTAAPVTTTTETPTTTMPIYALDPFYGPRLSRVDAIFHQLGLESEGCREQVVCNIYKNPDVYTPFSDYLSRQLTVKLDELTKPKVSDQRILRFFRYLKAAREGQDGDECLSRYPSCPTDTTRLSHKPTFKAFDKVRLLIDAGGQ